MLVCMCAPEYTHWSVTVHEQHKQCAQPITYNATSSDGLEGTVKALLMRRWKLTLHWNTVQLHTHTLTDENTGLMIPLFLVCLFVLEFIMKWNANVLSGPRGTVEISWNRKHVVVWADTEQRRGRRKWSGKWRWNVHWPEWGLGCHPDQSQLAVTYRQTKTKQPHEHTKRRWGGGGITKGHYFMQRL